MLEDLLVLEIPQRDVLDESIDVDARDVRVVVSLQDVLEVDVRVLLPEGLEGGGREQAAHSRGASSPVAEEDRQPLELKYTSRAHTLYK